MTDNTVKQETLEQMIDNAEYQEFVVWNKEMLISYKLENGFTICGRSAKVDPKGWDIEVGRDLCREDAINQLWELEGYRLQWKLYEEGSLRV